MSIGFLSKKQDDKEPTKTAEIEDDYDVEQMVEADSSSPLPKGKTPIKSPKKNKN